MSERDWEQEYNDMLATVLESGRAYENIIADKNAELARLRKIAAAARTLVEQWQKEALNMVPEAYSSRDLHYKYFKLDNEAGGMMNCAEQLLDALNDSEPT